MIVIDGGVQQSMKTRKLIKNEYNTRINYINFIRSAVMIFNGVVIGVVSEESNDSGETDWVIRILWDAWEQSGRPQVAGIDMDLRLEEYIRSYVPVFIEERTLPDTRDGLYEELARKGMFSNDRFEFMCRNHGLCGCNDITVERLTELVLDSPILDGDEESADKNYEGIMAEARKFDIFSGRAICQ